MRRLITLILAAVLLLTGTLALANPATAGSRGSDSGSAITRTTTAHGRHVEDAKQRTRLTVRTVHVRHGFWRLTGTLTRDGKPWVGRKVSAQAKYGGIWGNVKTKVTVKHGKVYFTARPQVGARKFPIRLHTNATAHTRAANSRTFRIYP